MVGLVAEQHFLPIFPHVLEVSPKYLSSKKEMSIGVELGTLINRQNKLSSSDHGKWSGTSGKRFPKPWKNEDSAFSEVQELMENSKILCMKWRNENIFSICLADGKLINIAVKNLFAGEYYCSIDKYYTFQEPVSDIAYNDRLILYLISDGRLQITWREPSSLESDFIEPDFISFTYSNLLPNKISRRSEKRLSLDATSNAFAIWWSTSKDDVLPWLPNPEQRANIFVFSVESSRKEPALLWYHKTDNDLLTVHLLPEANRIILLDKSANAEGNIIVTETIYNTRHQSKEAETIVPLQSELTAHAYDNTASKLAITCCDSSILIYIQESKASRTAKTTFIPTSVSWHPNSHIVFIAGDNGQYQLFDIALNPMLILENNVNTLSRTHELALSSPVQKLCWIPTGTSSGDSVLLLRFQAGPLTILRLALRDLGFTQLVESYLSEGAVVEAINVLKSVQWMPDISLEAMHSIFCHLLRTKRSDEVECHFEQLLAIYFVPTGKIDGNKARKTDLEDMRILARRFFAWLLLQRKYQRAMQIATSLNDLGLFHRLYVVARATGDSAVALEAKQRLDDASSEYSSSESESDSDSEGSWSSSTESEESYPSCQSSEVETEESYLPKETTNTEQSTLSHIHINIPSSGSDPGMTDSSKISVINFGQV